MSDVIVLGAQGALGSALVARLAELGVEAVGHVDVRGDAVDDAALRAALGRARVVVDATATDGPVRRSIAQATVAAGCHLIDPTPSQPHVRWLAADLSGTARAAGVAVVAAAGMVGGLGPLLATQAMLATTRPEQVHVAYLVMDRGMLVRGTPGLRAAALALLGEPGVAFVDGELESEWLGEARRLAWFARPVGPHHAAGVPGAEAILVPPRAPTLRTVRSYAAVRTARAELLQLVGNAARWEPARRRLRRLLTASTGASGGTGPGARWAVVAEVSGADGAVARAWANGRGVHATTAAIIETAVARLLRAEGGAARAVGTVSMADLDDAGVLLDELAVTTDLRWSVIRPDG